MRLNEDVAVNALHLSRASRTRVRGILLFAVLLLVVALVFGWSLPATDPGSEFAVGQAAAGDVKPAKKKGKKPGRKKQTEKAPAAEKAPVEKTEPVRAVTDEHLLNAGTDNSNWLMYGRTYNAHRHS